MRTEIDTQDVIVRGLTHVLTSRGAMNPIVRLSRRRSDYQSSFHLDELRVVCVDGSQHEFMLKEIGSAGLSKQAVLARHHMDHDPRREPGVYEHILAPAGLGPRTYGIFSDECENRSWLLIEKVKGIELYQSGEIAVWQEAARWLARLHALFAGKAEHLTASVPLLRYDSRMAAKYLATLLEANVVPVRKFAQDLGASYGRVLDVVFGLPQTFLHGDFYASNILIRVDRGSEVVPVDWELAGCGPGLLDLAALVSGRWSAAQRIAIASAYHSTWTNESGQAMPFSTFRVALDCARLVLALRWLAAPREWYPPEDHVLDWFAEAYDLSKSMGLLPGSR